MSFCPNCGNQIEAASKFCRSCGAPVAPAVEAEPVVPVAEPVQAPVEAAPAYQAPVEAVPAYQAPVTPAYQAPAYQEPAAPVYQAPAYQAPPAPTYQAPTYQAPVYQAPIASEPVVSGSDKAKGIVGMALAIGGLFFAVIGLLYAIAFLEIEEGMSLGMAIGFGIFSLPLSIVGKKLSASSAAAGNTSATCSVGNKLGLAGIIVSAVMFFFGFISIML